MAAPGVEYDGVDAMRADGGLVHIRGVRPEDLPALTALRARASDRSIYLRFLRISGVTAEHYVASLFRPNAREHRASGVASEPLLRQLRMPPPVPPRSAKRSNQPVH